MDDTTVPAGARVRLDQLWDDPYPIYAALRREPPCYVPAAGRYLVTRYADIVALERDPQVFSAAEQNSLMIRVMGHTMLRKDGETHRRERVACEPSLKPALIKSHWLPAFHRIVDDLLDALAPEGEADLFDRFAAPCAAQALGLLLGLPEVPQAHLREWSQAMMDATGNYGDDPEIWRRSEAAAAGLDDAVNAAIQRRKSAPDHSLISSMLHAADPLSREEIGANVKVIIGGGLNEPRDAIATAAYALLAHPDQRARVEGEPALWKAVFEETVRWISPIGMYPRQTTRAVELGGMLLPEGARIGVVLASGNRDERMFERADEFDIFRPKKPHIAFGGGPHFCLGAWAARALVGEVALPKLFARFNNLRLSEHEATRFGGWVFRGPLNLPCRWDA